MAVCIGIIVIHILGVAVNKEPTTMVLSSDSADEDHLDVDGAVLANMYIYYSLSTVTERSVCYWWVGRPSIW